MVNFIFFKAAEGERKGGETLAMTAVDVMPLALSLPLSLCCSSSLWLQLAALTINEKQFMPQKARRTWPKRAEGEGVGGGVGERRGGAGAGVRGAAVRAAGRARKDARHQGTENILSVSQKHLPHLVAPIALPCPPSSYPTYTPPHPPPQQSTP